MFARSIAKLMVLTLAALESVTGAARPVPTATAAIGFSIPFPSSMLTAHESGSDARAIDDVR